VLAGHNKPGLYSFLAPRNGDVDRSQGIIVDDPASVAAFAKDYEQCKKNPDRLIYEPVDSEGRVWLFESTLFICPAKEGKAFMLDETKNEYLQEWGQPNCGKKVTYVPVRHIKSSKYGSKSSSSSTTDPAFDYRVKIVLEKEATRPMRSAPDQHGGGGGKHKAWLTKLTKNRFSSDDKKILIGCGLLRDNDGSAEKRKSDKKELFKACKNQAEKLSDAINAATKYANGGKSSDTDKYSKLASLIENVADESRGALMNVVGAQASGTGLTGFTQGYMTTPTIGQGGQIGGAFEESDSLGSPERNKLFAAALSCATGVAMTLVTAGAGAGVGLGMASSCVMLLGRGIKAIMEFFVGKSLYLADPPEYENDLKWTKEYVTELSDMAYVVTSDDHGKQEFHEFSSITVETLKQINCAMAAMKAHMTKVSATRKDELAAIKAIENSAAEGLKELRVMLNQVVNVESLKILVHMKADA